jgi:ech hydrogenase subunit B
LSGVLLAGAEALGLLLLVPLAGGLLTGADRKISAKMQRRKGPPLLQPFYDVGKLLQKQDRAVNPLTRFLVTFSMCFTIFATVIFLMGADLLVCIFAFMVAYVFFVVAGYSAHSPYSFIGAERELIQIMCFEPMILIMAFAYYQATGSFSALAVSELSRPLIFKLPFIFLGLCYVLTVKLRKSPFDLSMSHHAHQEIVRGVTTELTGSCLAMVEATHWFETVFSLGLVYLFFAYNTAFGRLLAVFACLLVYFFEIVIDNAFARTKWQTALKISWAVILSAGGVNLVVLSFFAKG